MAWNVPGIFDPVQYAAPVSGATVAMNPGMTALILQPAGLLAFLTITAPANPMDGQRFLVCSTAAITSLTFNGGTFFGGVSSLLINGWARHIYSVQAGGWVRSG